MAAAVTDVPLSRARCRQGPLACGSATTTCRRCKLQPIGDRRKGCIEGENVRGCVGDALEITRPRRSSKASSATSMTPQTPLEISTGLGFITTAQNSGAPRAVEEHLTAHRALRNATRRALAGAFAHTARVVATRRLQSTMKSRRTIYGPGGAMVCSWLVSLSCPRSVYPQSCKRPLNIRTGLIVNSPHLPRDIDGRHRA